ncbi:hypothetical protein LTR36_003230 [Oleoguttula mirabilis]|uniref:Uncharacterized protein n=1 Tax=Oleoguttula mirabilis TaxID=1507867 RepID=A0AAV9K052_9PEZI|nr:hypothetical protein LTR36_003230 [Oleoguttula mirabilis]
MRKNFDSLKQHRAAALCDVPVEYIITVPAIWTDKATDTTREYATEAGMDRIQVIKEPEAAGIYALDTMRNHGLERGDTFVICDAGGGTVDLISYTVQSLKPTVLNEAAEGSGGLCGGSFLNRMFESYLDNRFRQFPRFDKLHKKSVMNYFEDTVKRKYSGSTRKIWTVRVGGLGTRPELGINRDFLEIPEKDLAEGFTRVIRMIIGLVLAQIRATNKTVKSVLLAGGFGGSSYLRRMLEDEMTAQRLSTRIVKIPNRKYDAPSGKYKIKIMRWGTLVKESEQPKYGLYACKKLAAGHRFEPMHMTVYTYTNGPGERPPLHWSSDLTPVANITAKIDRIPSQKLRRDEREQQYIADFDIETSLLSANTLKFTMIVDGIRYDEDSVGTQFI